MPKKNEVPIEVGTNEKGEQYYILRGWAVFNRITWWLHNCDMYIQFFCFITKHSISSPTYPNLSGKAARDAHKATAAHNATEFDSYIEETGQKDEVAELVKDDARKARVTSYHAYYDSENESESDIDLPVGGWECLGGLISILIWYKLSYYLGRTITDGSETNRRSWQHPFWFWLHLDNAHTPVQSLSLSLSPNSLITITVPGSLPLIHSN